MYTEIYACRKQIVIVHETFVLNIVSTDVVAIIHGSFVLEWVCTVLVGKVQGALRVYPVESLVVFVMYMTGRMRTGTYNYTSGTVCAAW